MRVWKTIPLFLILFTLNSCSSGEANKDETTAPADSAATPASKDATATKAPAPAAPAKVTLTLPAETDVEVILSTALNSGKNKAGDEFDATLGAPLSVDGKTVFDRGAKIHGKLTDVEGSGRVKGLANMRLTLLSIDSTPVSTKPFFVEAEGTKGRDAAVIGGAAGVGAAIGAIAGGKKGAAIGAGVGGGAGTGTVLATKGKEVDFPSESKLTFKLADALSVTR
jgi:hypothetical protein